MPKLVIRGHVVGTKVSVSSTACNKVIHMTLNSSEERQQPTVCLYNIVYNINDSQLYRVEKTRQQVEAICY